MAEISLARLREIFDSVEMPTDSGTDSLPIREIVSGFYALRDSNGYRGLFVEVASGEKLPFDLNLATLSIQFADDFSVRVGDRQSTLTAALVLCKTQINSISELFDRFVLDLVTNSSTPARASHLSEHVNGLATLFSNLSTPARNSVTGLLGELVVIDSSDDPEVWIRGWHETETSLIDFVLPDHGIEVEVKATTMQKRVHRISHQQGEPNGLNRRYFASVMVDYRESGSPVSELVSRIEARLSSQVAFDGLWRVLAEVGGSDLDALLSRRFDYAFSSSSLQFYEAGSVPKLALEPEDIDYGVSQISFNSDFSLAEAVPRPNLDSP